MFGYIAGCFVSLIIISLIIQCIHNVAVPKCCHLDCWGTFCNYRNDNPSIFLPKMTYDQITKLIMVKELKPQFCYGRMVGNTLVHDIKTSDVITTFDCRERYFVYWTIDDGCGGVMLNPKTYADYKQMCKYTSEYVKKKRENKSDKAQLDNLQRLQKRVQEINKDELEKLKGNSNVLKAYSVECRNLELIRILRKDTDDELE